MQLACAWNLAQPAVECVAPTLIQEVGAGSRPVEEKRAELAALPAEPGLSPADVEAIREIGDNSGSMDLKGASVEHEGTDQPDRWSLNPQLSELAGRWGIDPARDLDQDRLTVSAGDRVGARIVTSGAARAAAFVCDFAAALIRAARGNPHHPEERRS